MKKNNIPRMELLCSRDDLRPALQGVYIDGDYAVATNGHLILKAKISGNISSTKYADKKIIKREVWSFLTHGKTSMVIFEKDCITISHKGLIIKFPYSSCIIDEEYPDYQKVLNEVIVTKDSPVKICHINVKPYYIEDMRLAMREPSTELKLIFYGERKPILCYSEHFEGVGLVMPAMSNLTNDTGDINVDYDEIKEVNKMIKGEL